MTEDHYRKLERLYAGAAINQLYRPTIAVGGGAAAITMPVRPEFFHAAHALHGSVYFKALDDAAFFAVNSVVPDRLVLTVTFTTYLLRPVQGGVLTARGRVVSQSRRLYVAEADLRDENDATVARGSGSFLPSSILLTPDVGYA